MIPRTAIPISNEELFSLVFPTVRNGNEEIADFERNLAGYLGARKVFAVNAGRTALYLALQSLGLKPGESVIVPAYTCAIVFEVILRLGLKPTLVDVNPETYNINPALISDTITSKTKAIVVVHLFGRPSEMDQIMEIANNYGLFVVEDVAQALGAEYRGVKTGTFGEIAIFSFGPGKSLTSGEGGAIAVNDQKLIEKVIEVGNTLLKPRLAWRLHVAKNIVSMKFFSKALLYSFISGHLENELNKADREILSNCLKLLNNRTDVALHTTIMLTKMPTLSARMAQIQLKKIEELNNKRIKNAVILTRLLEPVSEYVQLPQLGPDKIRNTFTRFPAKMKKGSRESLIRRIKKKGIDIEKPYHHLSTFMRKYSKRRYICAESLCESLITIPNHPCLNSKDLEKVGITFTQSIHQQALDYAVHR